MEGKKADKNLISREQAIRAVSEIMAHVLVSGFAGKVTYLDELNERLKEHLRNLPAVSVAGNRKDTDGLPEYMIEKMHWCPFKDETEIGFEKECVGFGEPGCKECILKHVAELNKKEKGRKNEKKNSIQL